MAPRGAIVVDGSNVACEEQTDDGRPRIANIELAIDALSRQYEQVIVIVDASLHHRIDRPAAMRRLLDEQLVRQAPAETPADYFILEMADALDADVLSNDRFSQYHRRWPWIEHRRIPFMIIDRRLIIYRPAQVESRMSQKEGKRAHS
ncbi:MAG: hypothetical protein QME94_06040 [Anaerolineae bacterium]|nr:hypothetical protein [Anaerolineae bacterium]